MGQIYSIQSTYFYYLLVEFTPSKRSLANKNGSNNKVAQSNYKNETVLLKLIDRALGLN
jgi:hypothetical protein